MWTEILAGLLLAALIALIWQYRAASHRISKAASKYGDLSDQLAAARLSSKRAAYHLDAIVSATEDAILIAGADGECRLLNEKARAYFGDIGSRQSLLAATQSTELDSLVKEARQASDGMRPVAAEIELRALGGRTVHAIVQRIAPQENGAREMFLILLRDITALRRLETVRRDFVANVSHELRTPLSSIKAMAETLRDGALEDPGVAKPFLETIVSETDRLVRLSADLLVLSRIEMRDVVKQSSDVAALIDSAVAWLDNQRAKAGLKLDAGQIERPLIAPCDTDEIAQVLVNLLDNAIKYTPRGGSIDVSARVSDGLIVVEVCDTGIGILQQDIPRLFERFYRTDKARSRQSGGTGLGLSIVKHIVERHGGGLWVNSEYNRGSTFGFSLPCHEEGALATGAGEDGLAVTTAKVPIGPKRATVAVNTPGDHS